jgi:hypothetical protein
MVGADRETFLKGRVENQKAHIFDEIIKVAQRIGAPAEMIASLTKAKQEIQFTKAMDCVKPTIPDSLMINGQNEITLLHSALSHGVHSLTDAKCLELAHDARVALAELSDRIGQLLKDEAELSVAVSRLSSARQGK